MSRRFPNGYVRTFTGFVETPGKSMYVFCVAPSGKIPIGTRYPGFTHLATNFDQFLLQTYLITSLLFLSFAEQYRLTFQESIRFQKLSHSLQDLFHYDRIFHHVLLCCLHTHFTIFRHARENKIRVQSIFQDSLSPSFSFTIFAS